MLAENVTESGTYQVVWENTSSRSSITTTVSYNNVEGLDFSHYCKLNLLNFDKFKDIEFLGETQEQFIRIIDYNNENLINSLIGDGYTVREFFQDKCILEKYNKVEI